MASLNDRLWSSLLFSVDLEYNFALSPSMLVTSNKLSMSTAQQTGELYTKAFSDGFLCQNSSSIVDGQWTISEFELMVTKKDITSSYGVVGIKIN